MTNNVSIDVQAKLGGESLADQIGREVDDAKQKVDEIGRDTKPIDVKVNVDIDRGKLDRAIDDINHSSFKPSVDLSDFTGQMDALKKKMAEVANNFKDGAYKSDYQKSNSDYRELIDNLKELHKAQNDAFNADKIDTSALKEALKIYQELSGLAKDAGKEAFFNSHAADTFTRLSEQGTQSTRRQIGINQNRESDAGREEKEQAKADAAEKRDRERQAAADEKARIAEETRQKRENIKRERDKIAEEADEVKASKSRQQQIISAIGSVAAVAINGGNGMFGTAGNLLGSIGGPVGSYVGGAIGGKIDATLDSATQEAIAYSELRRMLGGTSVDFENLRGITRQMTDGFTVSLNESAQLAKQFAKISAINPNDTGSTNLAEAVRTAIGFAQGAGIAPQVANQFFAAEQLFGVTKTDADGKRLALQIADATAKSGTSSKMDEVLSVIMRYTETTAANAMMVPDVSQYASMLSNLMSSSTPGINKNPNVAASTLGAAEGGFKGAKSLPQLTMLEAAMRRYAGADFTAMDLQMLQSTSVFSSPAKDYGPGGSLRRIMEQNHDVEGLRGADIKASSPDATISYLNKFIEQIEAASTVGGHIDTRVLTAQAQQMGMSIQQFAELQKMMRSPGGFGTAQRFGERIGLDVDKLSPDKISVLAEASQNGGRDLPEKYAEMVKAGKVDKGTQDEIVKLREGAIEYDKKIVDLLMHDTNDEGLRAQRAAIEMQRDLEKLVSGLLPMTTAIKEGIIELVKGLPDALKSDSAKAFIGKYELADYAKESGVNVGTKSASGAEVKSQEADREFYELMHRNGDEPEDEDEKEEYRANVQDQIGTILTRKKNNPDAYYAGYSELIRKYVQDKHLYETRTYTDAHGRSMAVPLSGVSISGEQLQDERQTYKIIDRLMNADPADMRNEIDSAEEARLKDSMMLDKNLTEFIKNIRTGRDKVYDIYNKATLPPSPLDELIPPETVAESPGNPTVPPMRNRGGKSNAPAAYASQSQRHIAEMIAQESAKQGATAEETAYILAIAEQESGFGAGSRNIFQLQPETAKHVGVDPKILTDNIYGGVNLLLHTSGFHKGMRGYEKEGMPVPAAAEQASKDNIGRGKADANGEDQYTYWPKIRDKAVKYTPDKVAELMGKIPMETAPDKIPDSALNKQEEEKRKRGQEYTFRHEPIRLDLSYTDAYGNPLATMPPVTARMSPPRPVQAPQ